MIGKQGKGANNTMLIVGILAVFVVGLFLFMNFGPTAKTITQTETVRTDDAGGVVCELAPKLTMSALDAEKQGTAVTVGYKYLVNDKYMPSASSSTEYQYGDTVQVIANASSYIDVLSPVFTMACGQNSEVLDVYDYAAPTIEIKQDNTVLTDDATGGDNNASAIGTGGSDTFEYCLTGADKDSTGEMLLVFEFSDNANVSTISMTGAVSAEEPSFYSNTLSSPFKIAYKIPAVIGAKEVCYDFTIEAKSEKAINGAFYSTVYAGEAFIDDDGSFNAWGVEDASGDTKYEATFDEDFYVTE